MRLSLFLPVLLLTVSTYSLDAYADKGGKGHGKHKNDHNEWSRDDRGDDDRHDHRYDRDERVVIIPSDRVVIRRYYVQNYGAHCPPGLAKKNNGCMPPGQAKKRYMIGQPLPDVVVWQPVPQPLLMQLQPVPVGYQYVMVDKDVLLMSEASHKIIDAVTLLSAVGN